MTAIVVTTLVYFLTLCLFTWYGVVNVRQTKTIEEWNEKTHLEIEVLKERNLDLEKRIKRLEHDLGMMVIEPEPDLEVKK